MGSNIFGNIFKMMTWGESHGPAIGVIVDGCPAGIEIQDHEINASLQIRAPGKSPHTSPRKENDVVELLSGVFNGKTTGTPISMLIRNQDIDSSPYELTKDLLRPGHANFTYLEKYGLFDYRGGGRASARETACRVAAGAIAKKFLAHYGIEIIAYIKQIGPVEASIPENNLRKLTMQSALFCPDEIKTKEMMALITKTLAEEDSIGGIVEFISIGAPAGIGDPVYEKLEARLGYAMLSLPASKGFEMGSGFSSARMKGSEHNDRFINDAGKVMTETNHAGGVLGGISTGMPICGRVAFKPTSSIKKPNLTMTIEKKEVEYKLPERSRHDPCVAIRAVPVVEAMAALVLADALLMNRCVQL